MWNHPATHPSELVDELLQLTCQPEQAAMPYGEGPRLLHPGVRGNPAILLLTASPALVTAWGSLQVGFTALDEPGFCCRNPQCPELLHILLR